MKLSELGEFGLIERLADLLPEIDEADVVGVGDDCAVLPLSVFGDDTAKGWQLLTTDSLVEGVHFRLDYSSLFDVGWKSLAVSLSDIAAMGGTPATAVVSVQLRDGLDVEDVEAVYSGIGEIARRYGVRVVGGDTVFATEMAITVTAVGFSSHKPCLRKGAVAGDDVWLSGPIGGAAAGLSYLSNKDKPVLSMNTEQNLQKHRRPEPRLRLGQELLSAGLASAMIDVSDGLIQDMEHIAKQSSVTAVLSLPDVPYQEGARESGLSEKDLLTGGDDYELLFTASPKKRGEILGLGRTLVDTGVDLRLIGLLESDSGYSGHGVLLRNVGGELATFRETFFLEKDQAKGYRHF